MSKTKADIITRGLRHVGIVAHDETPDGPIYDNAMDVLDSLLAGITATADMTSFPDDWLVPLANWLGAEMAPMFNKQSEDRRRARLRFMSAITPDDRGDSRDTDDDGNVSVEEVAAGERARYY